MVDQYLAVERRRKDHDCTAAVCVVGAGFSGVMAAHRLATEGHSVYLFDSGDEAGGVMRDDFVHGVPLLSGCQVIQGDAAMEYGFVMPAVNDLLTVPNEVSSWSQSSQGILREHGVEGPVSATDPRNWSERPEGQHEVRLKSATSRIASYSPDVQREFRTWISNLNLDPAQIDEDSLEAVQMKRVFFQPRYREATLELKARDPVADELLGVKPRKPRDVLFPRQGYSHWFRQALAELRRLGVHYFPSTVARPIERDGKLMLKTRTRLHNPRFGIWCANPIPVAKLLMPGVRWDNQSQLITAWHIDVEQDPNYRFGYVQFFGHPKGLMRATRYEYAGVQRVLVESRSSSRHSVELPADAVLEAARETGARPRGELARFTRRAYLTISTADQIRLDDLGHRLQAHGWLHGGWHLYSRSGKLAWIASALSSTGFHSTTDPSKICHPW